MPHYPRQWTGSSCYAGRSAIELCKRNKKQKPRNISKFEEEPELEILNGRYGPYIAYKGNYKIP